MSIEQDCRETVVFALMKAKAWTKPQAEEYVSLWLEHSTAIQQAEAKQPDTHDASGYAAFKAKADELFGWIVGLGGYDDAVHVLWDFAHQQPATGEPVYWKYQPQDGLKHPAFTEHEAIAIAHGKDGSVVPLYTHPAPSVPDDVVRDAAKEAVEELHKLNEYAIVYINDPEWTRVSDTCQKLIGAIDAAMLAAK